LGQAPFNCVALTIFVASLTIATFAQTKTPVIKVVKPQISETWTANLPASEKEVMKSAPANFYHLGLATVGGNPNVQRINLEFAQSATITKITSTADFKVTNESSCALGRHYQEGSSCSLVVNFAPKGPGHRIGKITIAQDQSPELATVGLGGYGYAPVVSFIPAVITTVPNTYPSKVGLLSGAHNLAIMGDSLVVADTGNNLVRLIDSGGTPKTVASGSSAPWGVTADTFGQIYFSRPAANAIDEIYDYGPVVQINGSGTGACPAATPCTLNGHAVSQPGELSMDPYNHMFWVDGDAGGAFSTVQPLPANLIFLYDPFPFQTTPPGAAAIDAGDNIYSLWYNGGECEIVQQSLYNAENNNVSFNKVAGGHTCGFSGDGGQANNAEIGSSIGQFTFDLAGNLYFTDTANQRVRRIDYTTGVIRTIAGNGTAGYTGDGGAATTATLSSPTGVAVDSEGNVFVISSAASGQVIRQVGPGGHVLFPGQSKGTSSAPLFITVSNTGNSTLILTNVVMAGTNPTQFQVDNTTTTCNLTAGAALASGATCKIGVIFTPTATGLQQATLNILDNSVIGNDSIVLKGDGTLPAATFKITAPANGASFVSGSAVTLSASVTHSGTQPTGKVQFKVDGANFGSAVTLSSGAASTSVTGLTTTSHTLSATYTGDANYAPGGPISVSIAITASGTYIEPPPVKKSPPTGSKGNIIEQ
jgi:hypothetical protein